MRRLVYQVYVGPRSKLYDFCVDSVVDYCAAHDITHIVQNTPILGIQPDPKTSGRSDGASKLGYLPIFEKANALSYLEWFDQVAVIDADVCIRPGTPNIFDSIDPSTDFAAVVERDMPITEKYRAKIRSYSHGQYGQLTDVHWKWDGRSGAEFMNMGVMVMAQSLTRFLDGQTPKEFLSRPEFKRFVDGVGAWKWSTDQTLMNWWVRSKGVEIQHLNWKWNALYGAVEPKRMAVAHFVHFFLRDHLPNKGEDVAEVLKTL